MINGIHSYHQVEYEFPSCQELKGWILWDEVKAVLHHVHGRMRKGRNL